MSPSDFTHGQRWQFGYGQRTREGIQCWSCQQGSYPGNNFGPEECQKYGKWIQCGPDEVSEKVMLVTMFFVIKLLKVSLTSKMDFIDSLMMTVLCAS